MMNFIKYSAILFFLFLGIQSLKGQNADELLQTMDALIAAPKDKEASVKMIMTNKSGKQKIREAKMLQKGMYQRLYRYTKPEDKVGMATLSLPGGKMWLYMPSYENPIKITLFSKSQAFTGTDFSHEDMSGIPYSERYTPTLVDSDIENTILLELTPKIKRVKYSKILLYMDKTYKYPIKMKYYNKSNKLDKEATYTYGQENNYWYAKEVFMTTIKSQHSTRIILTDVKFDQNLSDDEFTVEKLKQ
jgi:outer membrane lipoprotein-sorting protein